jgi:hypothetical protein
MAIFRSGDYGRQGKYSDQDLDRLVADYDPARHEAPLVIGNPAENAPAYGWVESLKRTGSTLVARLHQVAPAFADLVTAGHFKKRLVSLSRTPDGKLQLRYVGFVGGQPPEIKGLTGVAFSAGSGSAVTELELSEEGVVRFTEGAYVKAEPESIEVLRAARTRAIEKKIEFGDALAEIYAERADAAAAATAFARANRDPATRTVQELKDARRWSPAFDVMKLPAIFAELAKSETKIEFGEGDKKTTKTALEILADFLKGLPEMSAVKFTDSACFPADPESIVTATAARARASEKQITFGDALAEIYAERAAAGAHR